MKILFVCTGNTCRSAMAEAIFKSKLSALGRSKEFKVSSAGLSAYEDDPMSQNALAALKKLGYKRVKHRARRFSMDMVRKFGLIVTMTQAHMRVIGNFPNVASFAQIAGGQDIADPYGSDVNVYIAVAKEIESAFDAVIAEAEKRAEQPR